MFFYAFELFANRFDPFANAASIGFESRLTGASRSDPAPLAGKRSEPRAHHSRQLIEHLRQLHLQLTFVGFGALTEDIENDLVSIHHARAELLTQVTALHTGECVIDDHHARLAFSDHFFDFLNFAGAHQGGRLILRQDLNDVSYDFAAPSGNEFLKFRQTFFDFREFI